MKQNNIIKSKKGQQLNQREVRLINEGHVEGLLVFDIKLKNNNFNLIYNVDGLINLKSFLQGIEMNKRLFIVLLRNIVAIFRNMDSNKLSRDLISLDISTSYVEPLNFYVYLMYIPIQPYETFGSLKLYLQEFISICNFDSTENIEYVRKLIEELNSSIVYTVSKLEEYCDSISKQLVLNTLETCKNICPSCSSNLDSKEDVCPFCGVNLREKSNNGEMSNENGLDSFFMQKKRNVNRVDDGVITVFRGYSSVQNVWLEDKSREGKINITKFPFRIGKMEGITDYRIHNSAVSRKHADIIKENGKYFIMDLDSTNGTYLYDKRLQAGVKEELADGAIIKFANSEFKFHID